MVKKQTPAPRGVGAADAALGQRIKMRRIEIEMSQTDLAEKLGVSFQQVQKYEKGRNRVGASRLQQIAGALNVPMSFFFTENGSGTQQTEVDSLIFSDTRSSLRLLRVYAKIKDGATRRHLVGLMERIAQSEDSQ